jgi:hypothetical protein
MCNVFSLCRAAAESDFANSASSVGDRLRTGIGTKSSDDCRC